MITLYQIFNGGLDVDTARFFTFAPSSGTRGHDMKLRKPQAQSKSQTAHTHREVYQQLEFASSFRGPGILSQSVQGPTRRPLEPIHPHHPGLTFMSTYQVQELDVIGP